MNSKAPKITNNNRPPLYQNYGAGKPVGYIATTANINCDDDYVDAQQARQVIVGLANGTEKKRPIAEFIRELKIDLGN